MEMTEEEQSTVENSPNPDPNDGEIRMRSKKFNSAQKAIKAQHKVSVLNRFWKRGSNEVVPSQRTPVIPSPEPK